MKRYSLRFLGIIIVLGLSACVTANYQVQVDGYTDPGAAAEILPGSAIFVIDNKEAQNPLLAKEIKAKINKLLEKRGFQVVPFEKAEYYLLFTYGIGQPQRVTQTIPDYSVGWGMSVGYPVAPGPYMFLWPGFVTYAPYTETLYDRWLLLNVIAGKPYREKGQFQTVWVGETRSTGTSADLRVVVNSLLLAAFEQFGKNTGKAVGVEINSQDPRFKELETVR